MDRNGNDKNITKGSAVQTMSSRQNSYSMTFSKFDVILTLNTESQYFYWTIWLMMIYDQTKFVCKGITGSEAIAEAAIF